MDKPVTQAVIDTGIVPDASLQQLIKWKLLPDNIDPTGEYPTPNAVVQHIQEALESGDAVETRDTDLDIVRQYSATKTKGKLYVPSPEDKEKLVSIKVEYGKTRLGGYVLPWLSESVTENILDDQTYLKILSGQKVYFRDVRELCYGDVKAFVICEPAESDDGR